MSKKHAISIISSIGLLLSTIYFLIQLIFSTPEPVDRKELLVYCGITMIKPMLEIAEIIEKRENIKISIIKGGSGNLLRSIKFNRLGDLYLPGSESYIQQAKDDGLVVESVHVGYNKAAIMVREGNPKGIQPGLDALLNSDYYIVLGNPDSGSIGKETKKILTTAGILDEVMRQVRELTTDSKRLIEVLKNGEADLVINWYATSTWSENSNHIDSLPIDQQYADKNSLVLGLLSTSKYPALAKIFMEFAASEEGHKIFDRYGLYGVY